MTINVITDNDSGKNKKDTASDVPEVLLTQDSLVLSTLIRNMSFQVGEDVAPMVVCLIASMTLRLNKIVVDMDEKLLNLWNNIPSNIVRLWISVLNNQPPYDVSAITPEELFNLTSVLMTNMTPIVLAHADIEPLPVKYNPDYIAVIPDDLMVIVNNLAVSVTPNELDSIIRTVRNDMGTDVTSDEVMLEATRRVWGDRIEVTDMDTVNIDTDARDSMPDDVVDEYDATADDIINTAKEEAHSIEESTTSTYVASSNSGGGSSSDDWGVGSYLLLAAAGVAVCYGGYKLFGDGEAEDLTVVDLDYSL